MARAADHMTEYAFSRRMAGPPMTKRFDREGQKVLSYADAMRDGASRLQEEGGQRVLPTVQYNRPIGVALRRQRVSTRRVMVFRRDNSRTDDHTVSLSYCKGSVAAILTAYGMTFFLDGEWTRSA